MQPLKAYASNTLRVKHGFNGDQRLIYVLCTDN